MNQREIGCQYEQIAAKYLAEQGYQILESNYQKRNGEIDLVAREQEYYVFVEVKYRSDTRHGLPQEAVTTTKMKHITDTARHYLMKHHLGMDTPCRFDVVVILNNQITLIRNAFDAV